MRGAVFSQEGVGRLSKSRIHLSRIIIVAKKELIDFVRDWRTVLAMILVPLLIFPAIFIALPLFLQGEAAELSAYELTVEVQGDLPDDLTVVIRLLRDGP